jgi:cold shock protein
VPKHRIVGFVSAWNDDEGWGVIDAPETPGGCFVHHANIVATGYRTLVPAEKVHFTFEQVVNQDGYHYRAMGVWRDQ